jgi:undecaprenyl-diphosphatase
MAFYHIFFLSLIQGLTEFLPISSSGHLIIIPRVLGWPDQGLAFDVAVHVGTLGAVLVYFWRDVWHMIQGLFQLLVGKSQEGGRRALGLMVGTIPAVLLGSYLSYIGFQGRALTFIGWTTLIYGLLLGLVDRMCPQKYILTHMTLGKSLWVGLAQALALFPGTSRSGACMTMGRLLGFNRPDAARYSFLLGIPAITAAGVHTTVSCYKAQGSAFFTSDFSWAIGLSFCFGLMAIHFMMRWLLKRDFTPFVLYRIALGVLLLALGYGYL